MALVLGPGLKTIRVLRPYNIQNVMNGNKAKLVVNPIFKSCMSSTQQTEHKANKRIVYRSSSNNIFENLSLEEWIYEHTDFTHTDVLLMWQSDPCVVIGKHQNPWIEANLHVLDTQAVHLARRSSGGGTVYHDKGNLNLSFLKDRSRYDRRENLELVVAALRSKWDLDLVVNERDDVILDGVHKISGTAAKLTRHKSYHHFTLLHSVDRSKLSSCLASPFKDYGDTHPKYHPGVSIESRSTKSVPAPVQNLQARAPNMTFDLLMEVIVRQFLGEQSTQRMSEAVTIVNPSDENLFPGVSQIRQRLQSWDWVFGKTPKFSVKLSLPSGSGSSSSSGGTGDSGGGSGSSSSGGLVQSLEIGVVKGRLDSFKLVLNQGVTIDLAEFLPKAKGLKMTRENLRSVFLVDLEARQNSLMENKEFLISFSDVDAKCVLESVRVCMSKFLSDDFL